MLDSKNGRAYYSLYKIDKFNNTSSIVIAYSNNYITDILNNVSSYFNKNNILVTDNTLCIATNFDLFSSNYNSLELNNLLDNVIKIDDKKLVTSLVKFANKNYNNPNYLKTSLTLDAEYVRPSNAEREKKTNGKK